jgi:hypothetical protein
MTAATYAPTRLSTFPVARPYTAPRDDTSTRSFCQRHGRYYATEYDCPCWTDLPEPRRSELRGQLTSWYAGFTARRPEFVLS